MKQDLKNLKLDWENSLVDKETCYRLAEKAFERHSRTFLAGYRGDAQADEHLASISDDYVRIREEYEEFRKNRRRYIRRLLEEVNTDGLLERFSTTFQNQVRPWLAETLRHSRTLYQMSSRLWKTLGYWRAMRQAGHSETLQHVKKPCPEGSTVTERALDWIVTSGSQYEPFFFWVHYMDVHGPYLPGDNNNWPKQMARYLAEAGQKPVKVWEANHQIPKVRRPLYAACVRYTDECVGQLLEALEDGHPDTLIVVTSDHGDELYEHGNSGHTSAKLYEELIRVPLIIRVPSSYPEFKRALQRFKDRLVGHIDLAPTILHACQIPVPEVMIGNNLFAGPLDGRENRIFCETLQQRRRARRKSLQGFDIDDDYLVLTVRTETHKLIYYEREERFEFFDLQADPQEQHNIYMPDDPLVGSLREALAVRKQQIRRSPPLEEFLEPELSEMEGKVIEEHLRGLGYLD